MAELGNIIPHDPRLCNTTEQKDSRATFVFTAFANAGATMHVTRISKMFFMAQVCLTQINLAQIWRFFENAAWLPSW